MLIRARTLSIVTTYQCTAACDHCCFTCSPQITKRIPREAIAALIADAAHIDSMRHVVFTGGECFLLGDELVEHVRHAASHGFVVRCLSNGYWAVNDNGAVRRLTPLREAGLRSLVISTGPMHARYVPVDRVRIAASTAAEMGCDVTVTLETFVGAEIDRAVLMSEPRFAALVDDGLITIDESPWVPEVEGNGSAELAHVNAQLRFRDESSATRCGSIFDTISATPNMRINACCGFPMENLEQLQLGSFAEATLRDVLSSAVDDFLRIWIHVDGPERILRFVRSHEPSFELPLDSAHICSSCAYLLKSETAMNVVGAHYREIEERVVNDYIALLRVQRDRLRAKPRLSAPGAAPATPARHPRMAESVTGL